jgi:light-regulated signal transduction histidine kinase (bacteriophytochrome)
MIGRSTTKAIEELDLAGCDREPIHIPGSIQPHGFLLVFTGEELQAIQASRNAAVFLGRPLEWILGGTLRDVLGRRVDEMLRATLDSIEEAGRPRYLGSVSLGPPGRAERFSIGAHRFQGALILEFEPVGHEFPATFENIYPLSNDFIGRVQAAHSIEELNQLAAIEIRRLTGFDRVLIYRFDPDWCGTVIAEDRNDELPSLLDHRFPASDIPKTARELYRRNRLRLIADAGYEPVTIVPALRPDTGSPLDLTYSSLRSVSPFHVEYMRNMGTLASMSISIIRDGELWGLISCHHSTPRTVPFLIRAACDLLGQVLSLQLEARDHNAEYEHRIGLKLIQSKLLASMAAEEDYRDGLVRERDELLKLASAGGAAIVADDRCTLIGQTPTEADVRRLVKWLDSNIKEEIYSTHSLSSVFPEAAGYAEKASGLLAISISKLHASYVLWFRPEVMRTLKWAGNPSKAAAYDEEDGLLRISPRKSFEIWQETVRHKSDPFRTSEVEAVVELRNAIIGVVLRKAEEMAELTSELERSNRELEAFSYSVSHDLRAPFRHIVGYSELLRESADTRLGPDERRYIEVIVNSAQQAGTLVDSLLSFSRMGRQQLNRRDVNMNELVAEAIRELSITLSADRKITWRVSTLPMVWADVMMLRQVVQNLLANAVKFTEPRVEATVEVGSFSDEREDIFFVRDNGVGFDMQYVGKLFGVFQRLHRMEDFEGTGIGLANVRRIVTRHGGRTWAEGALGVGATIYFTLPKIAEPGSMM